MTLARWTYTKEEWKAFLRSSKKKNNIFKYAIHFFLAKMMKSAPIVSITPERVSIGNEHQHFSSGKHTLRQIDLRDEGIINVLAIIYDRKGSSYEIKIPVPKGKLREAMEVQEQLINRC